MSKIPVRPSEETILPDVVRRLQRLEATFPSTSGGGFAFVDFTDVTIIADNDDPAGNPTVSSTGYYMAIGAPGTDDHMTTWIWLQFHALITALGDGGGDAWLFDMGTLLQDPHTYEGYGSGRFVHHPGSAPMETWDLEYSYVSGIGIVATVEGVEPTSPYAEDASVPPNYVRHDYPVTVATDDYFDGWMAGKFTIPIF